MNDVVRVVESTEKMSEHGLRDAVARRGFTRVALDGTYWRTPPRRAVVPMGEYGYCFQNALDTGLPVVVGFVAYVDDRPIMHAWNLDGDTVVEPSPDVGLYAEYLGFVIDREKADLRATAAGAWDVLLRRDYT
jgi:hypothetical protein